MTSTTIKRQVTPIQLNYRKRQKQAQKILTEFLLLFSFRTHNFFTSTSLKHGLHRFKTTYNKYYNILFRILVKIKKWFKGQFFILLSHLFYF